MPFQLTAATTNYGLMDGSPGIAISNDAFMTASDEENTVMAFSTGENSENVALLDLNHATPWFPARETKRVTMEAHIEGAAQIGSTVYCISSQRVFQS
jgi:hypothetical protein